MYPQGVCRIRKPAYAGNGCAIFLVFQTEEVGQKDGCGSQTQLRGVAFKRKKITPTFPVSVTVSILISDTKCGVERNDFFIVLKAEIFGRELDRIRGFVGVHVDL